MLKIEFYFSINKVEDIIPFVFRFKRIIEIPYPYKSNLQSTIIRQLKILPQ